MRAWQALLGVGGAALLVALPWLLPPFYANLLCFIAIYGGVATGLILLTGYAGLVSLGQGAFYGIGAYGAVVLAGSYGVDPWLSLLLGTLLAATAGYLVGLPILRLSGHYLALATLAWGIIATILFTQLASITGGPNGFTHVPVLSLFGLDFIDPGHFYYLTLVFAVLAVAALASLIRSRAGRAVRAMRSSEAAAASVGMEVGRIKLQVFVLAAALAGLGGALFAYFIAFISPSAFDLGASIRLLTMAMIGGAHPLGGVVGAAVVTLLDDVLQNVIPNASGQAGLVQVIAYGAILVGLMLVSPRGLEPLLTRVWRLRLRAGPAEPPAPAAPVAAAPEPGALPTEARETAPAATAASGEPPAAAGLTGLQVRGLGRRFGGLQAVDDLSFELRAGEILGLIGPNGAGKTTAFNVISGLLPPSEGRVLLGGDDVTAAAAQRMARRGLTRTFQNTALFEMSVLENVMAGCYIRTRGGVWAGVLGLGRADEARARREARRALARVGLTELAADAPSLPVGKQRLLEVARSLAMRPRVLLLDEPAAGLRYAEKRELAGLLSALRDEGLAILLVEHDMDLVMSVADRIVVMNYGQTLTEGTPEQVRQDPEVIAAYLGLDAA
ncbi:MAG: branched-chain amino acid ABC transporter ATP-binding protein/permease [Deinococcales bacterium]